MRWSKVNFEIIQTGSSGNAILVNNVLLDCGVAFSKIKKHLKNIRVIFISHSHS
nr:MAG TPA: RNaseZ [Caudoviricetes sp.]